MAHTKSAKKRLRQSEKRRLRNRAYRSRIKTFEKKYLLAISQRDLQSARSLLSEVFSAIDKAVQAGVLHWATGNRKKSRLAQKLSALQRTVQVAA